MQVKLRMFGSVVGLGLMLTATAAPALTPAEEGRRVYLEQNCYGCHGGRGGGGMGPALRREKPDLDDVSDAVRKGERRGMPAYPNLTALDIRNLTAYFRSLRTPSEPTFTHWWEPVPTR